MNYLGHLYFSNDDHELMVANLFGDFVKGRDLSQFSPAVQKGIRLHREIDHFIDTHPAVIELMHELYADLPKVAGIAVDLYFDHLLARSWNRFHRTPLPDFLDRFYASVQLAPSDFTDPFREMMRHLVTINWISSYPTTEGLNKACIGVSSRLSFANSLTNGLQVFLRHEKSISEAFEAYMHDAIRHFGTDR